jgi:UDP-glucose 4-epimerase
MNTIVVGGAGFIGSHFVDRLLAEEQGRVRVFDNFSSGREWHLRHHHGLVRFSIVRGDVHDLSLLHDAMDGFDRVIHLASNPDIAKAIEDPTIDFDQGTALTNSVIEAARRAGVSEVLYASGSGVYGDLGVQEAEEDFGPLCPTSPYGASKLAGEALMSAYSAMFGVKTSVFRFGNVVGPRQTHGVGFDFIRRLRRDPTHLNILGDGNQSKPYIHVDDVVTAVLQMSATRESRHETFNVASNDTVTVKKIARLALDVLNIDANQCEFRFSGGDRGWQGDIPVVRLSTERIRSRGWRCALSSSEAVRSAMHSLAVDDAAGRF